MKKITEKTNSRYLDHSTNESGNDFEKLRNRLKKRYPGLEEYIKQQASQSQLCGFCLSGIQMVLNNNRTNNSIAPVL